VSDPVVALLRVRSTGLTPAGRTETVSAFLDPARIFRRTAALMTKGMASFGGQFNVHWGDALARGNLSLAP